MATKIGIWNGAMLALGHRKLADTGEAVEAGRLMTDVWDQLVLECLSAGSWNFATETIKVESDTGVTPEFGYPEVFAKPTDWLRTVGVSTDEYFTYPLLQYYDDRDYWSADTTPIYVRYVSSDTGMGMELTRWTPDFTRYVELEMAARIGLKVTQSDSLMERIESKRDKARRTALNRDAMAEPNPKFPPPSGWTLARGSRSSRDRGLRSRLTGG